MVNIRQNLVSSSKYNIKCPYTMVPQGITVHNTANNAPAENEIAYMIRNNYEVSFHYAVDDKEIVQGIPDTRNAWHCGDGGNGTGNRTTIGVEICYSTGAKATFEKAQENAAEFVAYKLKQYGWDISKVYTHQHWNGKHCPHRTLDEYGWDYFLNLVKKYLGQSAAPATKPAAGTTTKALYRVRKTWVDSKSQIGAFASLENAKKACKEGYTVFDANGKAVYTNSVKKTNAQLAKEVLEGKWGNGDDRKKRLTAAGYNYAAVQTEVNKLVAKNINYKVRVTVAALNVRRGPGTNYGITKCIRDRGIYTIVDEANGPGATKWGKLKSGDGWIALDFVKKV